MFHRRSHQLGAGDRAARTARRLVCVLLLLACAPSLLLNVGMGRGLLIHDHAEGALHTHILAGDLRTEPGHRHEDHYAAGPRNPATSFDDPAENCHHDAVIPGSELACGKKASSVTDPASVFLHPLPLILATSPRPSALPRLAGSSSGVSGTRTFELTCLRAVILLT